MHGLSGWVPCCSMHEQYPQAHAQHTPARGRGTPVKVRRQASSVMHHSCSALSKEPPASKLNTHA